MLPEEEEEEEEEGTEQARPWRLLERRCARQIDAAAACEKKHHRNERFLCAHLRNAASLCVVSCLCPSQLDAIAALCSSAGTDTKRKQCKEAQRRLDACMSAYQHRPDPS